MKKLSVAILSLMMIFSLVGCGQQTASVEDLRLSDTTSYTVPSSRQLSTMDYVTTALAEDHEFNANFVDGLLENNPKGQLVGALAESWESNEDSTEWTFHLRQGVKWVTNTGEEYAEVTAQDFVTGLRHSAEFQSGTGTVIFGAVKGYEEYYSGGDFSDEAWANVGIEAVDDYTVKYTMETPIPYFPSMTTYSILYPVNKEFLESKGSGCVLGSPDKNACDFGTTLADSILYNGAFILETYDLDSQTVLTKNESYWDIDNVHLDTVTWIYDDGSDTYSAIRGFEQGNYAQAALNASWEDFDEYYAKYDGYVNSSLPNAYVFGVVFNYNRQSFNYTNYANDEAMRENTHNAIMNENFRKAVRASYDVLAKLMVNQVESVATSMIRNANTVPNLVTTSDGTNYLDLVEEAYTEATGETVDLSDGQYPWLNKEAALGYIEAAKAEGIEFPVHLDMLVTETSDSLVKEAQSMKQSIEENTDGQIIIEIVLQPEETVNAVAYDTTNYADADFDISTYTGWGPDYLDPKTFVDIYSPTVGYYMHAMGLTDQVYAPDAYGSDDDVKEAVGWNEYEELYRTADAITDNLDNRYRAFALADAYLIEHCLYIPTQQQRLSSLVSFVVPFSKPYSIAGISQYKFKYTQLQETVVTTEAYEAARAEWAS